MIHPLTGVLSHYCKEACVLVKTRVSVQLLLEASSDSPTPSPTAISCVLLQHSHFCSGSSILFARRYLEVQNYCVSLQVLDSWYLTHSRSTPSGC